MTAGRDATAGDERVVHAYHDGELGWLARRRFERRLAHSPRLRRELETLEQLGELARRADSEAEAPDLWADIARQLPGIDREREPSPAASWGPSLLRPLAATAAVAALMLAVAVGLRTGETGAASSGVVRWMDMGPHNVIVLEAEPANATIIWVLDSGSEVSQGRSREVV